MLYSIDKAIIERKGYLMMVVCWWHISSKFIIIYQLLRCSGTTTTA